MEIHGNEIIECCVEDMVPGNYYYSRNRYKGWDIILPLDTKGNIVVFAIQEAGYYALHEVTTCDKRGISKVGKVNECRLVWRRAWGSDINYVLTVLIPNLRPPERRDMLMNWVDAFTTLIKNYQGFLQLGVLYLSCLGTLVFHNGCIHLDWTEGGAAFMLKEAGYLNGWDIPKDSEHWPSSDF